MKQQGKLYVALGCILVTTVYLSIVLAKMQYTDCNVIILPNAIEITFETTRLMRKPMTVEALKVQGVSLHTKCIASYQYERVKSYTQDLSRNEIEWYNNDDGTCTITVYNFNSIHFVNDPVSCDGLLTFTLSINHKEREFKTLVADVAVKENVKL